MQLVKTFVFLQEQVRSTFEEQGAHLPGWHFSVHLCEHGKVSTSFSPLSLKMASEREQVLPQE